MTVKKGSSNRVTLYPIGAGGRRGVIAGRWVSINHRTCQIRFSNELAMVCEFIRDGRKVLVDYDAGKEMFTIYPSDEGFRIHVVKGKSSQQCFIRVGQLANIDLPYEMFGDGGGGRFTATVRKKAILVKLDAGG